MDQTFVSINDETDDLPEVDDPTELIHLHMRELNDIDSPQSWDKLSGDHEWPHLGF